jgi:dihydrofolate synthase/folylpolyglutamate synthase
MTKGVHNTDGGRPAAGAPSRRAVAVDAAETARMDYAGALRFLDAHTNVETMRPSRVEPDTFRLDRMRALLTNLGEPHAQFRAVHVAGSKGKGSVCEMLASCLGSCGYTAGLYTSPHLVDIRERVRIAGHMIGEQAFASCMRRVAEAVEAVKPAHGPATFFEILTALAFLHFAEQAVDIAIIEVGLGGRLDSTNTLTPELCAITEIALEHTQLLGDTHEKIAREKAGIMKPGVPCYTIAAQKPEVLAVFEARAAELNAPLRVLGRDVEFTSRFESAYRMGPHHRVSIRSPRGNYEHIPAPLPGDHQAQNTGLVLALLDGLRQRGFDCPEPAVVAGLAATPRNGRAELILDRPRILVDGAHTPESVGNLMRALGSELQCQSTVVVFGCAQDKDIDGMLREVARGADKVIFTRSADNPRAMDPAELCRRFIDSSGKMAQTEPTLREAINTAARAVGRDDLIVVTGSFYLAGEAKRLIDQKKRREATA